MAMTEQTTPDVKQQDNSLKQNTSQESALQVNEQSNVTSLNQSNKPTVDLNELQEFDNVQIVTSLDRIGAALGYLAQCDYAIGNNGDALNGDEHFGRGYLLEMLGNGVSYFAQEYEQTIASISERIDC